MLQHVKQHLRCEATIYQMQIYNLCQPIIQSPSDTGASPLKPGREASGGVLVAGISEIAMIVKIVKIAIRIHCCQYLL